jgi:tRNA A-37 threonylcarbamoyl transferase component Bud32
VAAPARVSDDERLWLGLAVQLGLLTPESLAQVLAEPGPDSVARRVLRRQLVSQEDLEALQAMAARAARAHGDSEQALAFLTTCSAARTEPGRSLADTAKSGESRSFESLEGLDFVLPELAGRYRAERDNELGRGGLGRVVAIRDQVTGREVAMKQLLPERSAHAAQDTAQSITIEARFLREARLAAQLEHPSIVPVFEVGRREDGSLYYTMRRIRGRTLSEAIRVAQTMPERLRLVPRVLAVAQALAYAHSRDVIHRDVKPQNIMLGTFGETYLLDWGLARIKGKADPRARELAMAPDITGEVRPAAVGTPAYMSPEQAAGRVGEMDERTDVWGLGAVLYELLTGRPPYIGQSAIEVIQQVLTDDWTPVKTLAPDAPGDLVAVCACALAKQPDGRYGSAQEFARDLEAWLEGRQVSVREYSGAKLAVRFVRRNPVSSAVVTALVVALLAVGASSWVKIRAQRNSALAFATVLVGDVSVSLYRLAGGEEVMDRLARETASFLGQDPGFDLDDPGVQLPLARSLALLGQTSLNVGRVEDATRYAEGCVQVMWRLPKRLDEDPDAAAAAVRCLALRARVVAHGRHLTFEDEPVKTLAQFVAAREARWETAPAWGAALSMAYSHLFHLSFGGDDEERTRRYLKLALTLDEQRSDALEDPEGLVVSLRDAQLMEWSRAAPDAGLALGERALSLARRIPRRLQNGALMNAWLSVLTQHKMLLSWSDRGDDARALLVEGDRLVEQLMSVDPDRAVTRTIVGDYLLMAGRPREAAGVMADLIVRGERSEVFATYVWSSFLAGDDPKVLEHRADLERSQDEQVHLTLALALATTGALGPAAAHLRQHAQGLSDAPLQWPRGCLEPRVRSTPAPLGPALAAFSTQLEAAMPGDVGKRLEALTALADALERAAASSGASPR